MTAPVRHPLGIPVVWPRQPFGREIRSYVRTPGMSIEEIVLSIPDLPDRFYTHGEVRVWEVGSAREPDIVPRNMWGRVRPHADGRHPPVEVLLTLPLGDPGARRGGEGGKNTFAIVASIALLAVTAAISGGALGPAGLAIAGGLFAAGSTSATLLAAAVGIAGGLAITALSAPPVPKKAQRGERELGSASAEGNVLEKNASIPRVIGTYRAFPALLAFPLIEQIEEDEYVEMIAGFAGRHNMTDWRLGDTSIDDLDEVSYETRAGTPTDAAVTLITRQGFTASGVELSNHKVDPENQVKLLHQSDPESDLPQWHTFVTRDSPNQAWLHLFFPEGLARSDEPTQDHVIPFRLRMRVRGTTTWKNLPEVAIRSTRAEAVRKQIRLIWAATPPNVSPPQDDGFVYAHRNVPSQSGVSPASSTWTAHSYFDDGSGDDYYYWTNYTASRVRNVRLYHDRADFYLSGGDFPLDTWEVQVKRGNFSKGANFILGNTYTYDSDTAGVHHYDFFHYFIDPSTSDKVIPRSQENKADRTLVSRFVSVWNEHPIQTTGLALIAIKAKNRAIERVSALASGLVQDWDGTTWGPSYVATSNPAPHYRDMLIGEHNADPLPSALLDQTSIVAWRQRCIEDALEANFIMEGKTVDEGLNLLASAGFARPLRSETWGVMQDQDRSSDAPVQTFTPRNSNSFRLEKGFPKLPHAFRVRFRNRVDDYQDDEIIVPDEGFTIATATRLEDVTYEAIVDQTKILERAQFDLKQARLRNTFYYLDAPAENIVCRRGDLIAVQNDVLSRQVGYARIAAIHRSGGSITGLLLDSFIPVRMNNEGVIDENAITGVAIRLEGTGVLLVKRLAGVSGEQEEITFQTPFADPGSSLTEGCLVVSGPLDSEYRRLVVRDIQPGRDLTASLTLLDEAPTLFAAKLRGAVLTSIATLRTASTLTARSFANRLSVGSMTNAATAIGAGGKIGAAILSADGRLQSASTKTAGGRALLESRTSILNAATQHTASVEDMLNALGITGWDFILDAGTSDSYPGTGQTWTDLTGNGNSFFRGSGSGADAADPTFNGVANARTESEYFSFDGGDRFVESAGHTFAEPWHKNNGAFTLFAIIYLDVNVGTGDDYIFATHDATTATRGMGWKLFLSGANTRQGFDCTTGTAIAANIGSTINVGLDGWHFVCISQDEASASGLRFTVDASTEALNGTYSSPSASNTTIPYNIGSANGVATATLPAGTRIGCIAGRSSALTSSQIQDIRNKLKERWTSLP